ncbi:hypothetical protein M378DRAFT_527765 [Amanita muscaria Koide BX008]|uniref:Uncharacterized protein n=1 Tax=Amanita muscaria (strain Koide BX008) TaxID=946122 RepID=A0A0C2TEX9_AMAMK|nr:hypothetical protein M378DRAFT_527765 [Amanita muscaria Koide BX008]
MLDEKVWIPNTNEHSILKPASYRSPRFAASGISANTMASISLLLLLFNPLSQRRLHPHLFPEHHTTVYLTCRKPHPEAVRNQIDKALKTDVRGWFIVDSVCGEALQS